MKDDMSEKSSRRITKQHLNIFSKDNPDFRRYAFSSDSVDRSNSRAREPIATVYVISKGIMVEWLSSNRIKRRHNRVELSISL